MGSVCDLLVGDCTLVCCRSTYGLLVEVVLWSGRISGSFVTDVFLWTVCISVVPDSFWTRRRSEAFVGDDGLYGTAAFVSEDPSPWWPSWTFLLSKRWGYTCCCAGVFLPLYQGMTITSSLLWLFCLNAVKVGIFCHQLNLQKIHITNSVIHCYLCVGWCLFRRHSWFSL